MPTEIETRSCGCVVRITVGTDGEAIIKICKKHSKDKSRDWWFPN